MLTITKRTTKKVPVTVLNCKWLGATKGEKLAAKLKCKTCGKLIGHDRFGIAWLQEGNNQFSARLCGSCMNQAEIQIVEQYEDNPGMV